MNKMRKKLSNKGSHSEAHLPSYYKKSASSSCGRKNEQMQPIAEALKYSKADQK